MEVKLFLFAVGYLVIIIAGVVAALVWAIRRKLGFLKGTGLVLATLFVIYAIPFGDHTLGEIKKYQLCKEHGGTKIFQVVENVDGFMWETGRQMQPYDTYGYAFVEVKTSQGELFRYIQRADGIIDEARVEKPQARYLAQGTPYEKISARHSIRRFTIQNIRDSQILASHGIVAYDGGWMGFGSLNCSGDQPQLDRIGLIHKVLIRLAKSKE